MKCHNHINSKDNMKKYFLPAIAAIAMLGSCQSKTTATVDNNNDNEIQTVSRSSQTTYKVMLPAADCPGIEYSLSLDEGKNGYILSMTYIDADGAGNNKTFTSEGEFELIKNDSISFYLLKSDDMSDPQYFKIINDSTLRMINSELQEAESCLNYDIVKVKN